MEKFTPESGVRRPQPRGASTHAHLDLHLQADPRHPDGRPGPGPGPAGEDRVRDGDRALRRLVTIPISHFCEKARWALDRAGLAYVEEPHVQGLHRLAARRAGGGRSVPVLVTPEGVFAQSEWIIRYADAYLPPQQRLFTTPEVAAFCRWLDAGLGADSRRLIYKLMLPRPELMLPYNNQGVPAWEGRALSALFPVARAWASRELALTDADDAPLVFAAFDTVAAQLGDQPFLFGERFTAADLTFACLAAAVVLPPEYGVQLPDALPELQAFREHPAGAYALRLFEELRYSSAAAGSGA